MSKIKTKKEMNLGELLCWAIDNKEQARFRDFSSKNMRVRFNDSGYPCIEFEKKFLPTYETFTVEIEEEITEDTVFDKLISRYVSLSSKSCYAHSINTCIKGVIEDREAATHIYIENEDNELQLIWRDGKLVE